MGFNLECAGIGGVVDWRSSIVYGSRNRLFLHICEGRDREIQMLHF